MKALNFAFRGYCRALVLAALVLMPLGLQAATSPKVLLLLHGMNSSPDAWNDFVASQFSNSNNKGVLRGGVLVTGQPKPNSRGVYCYAVEAGAYDATSGRVGLEGIEPSSTTAGDFSEFPKLGKEVDEAIQTLLTLHSGAKFTLLAHSRGGLAARSFLQNTDTTAPRSAVISLLTTGSPHKGSRLGRIHPFLEANPRTTNPNDWRIVDTLRNDYDFDVRRPVINDLRDGGTPVTALNNEVSRMPASMTYGNLRYISTDLGYLGRSWGISYNVFYGLNAFFVYIPPLSSAGRTAILGAGKSASNYKGDGIVEADAQNLLNLAGRPSFSKTYDLAYTRSVYHTEETDLGQVKDMTTALKYLTGWWR